MNYSKWIVLCLSVLFFLPTQASAGWLGRIGRKLNLSDGQLSQIRTIVYQSRRSQIALKAQLQLSRLDLRQLLEQHKPNEAKVIAAIDKAGANELALKKSRILMMVRIKAILTPQQAAKWNQIRNRRQMRRRKMRKRMRRMMRQRRRRMRRQRMK